MSTFCHRVGRVFRGSVIGALLLVVLVVAPAARADEPLAKGAEGAFVLHGTHGYKLLGIVGSTGTPGPRGSGVLILSVSRKSDHVTYFVRGEVTKEHVHFDLGALGEIDAAVQPTGRNETVRSKCGKSATVEGQEYVGTVDFHGAEGFTEAAAARTPLRLDPLANLVCAGIAISEAPGGRGPGIELKVAAKRGPRLTIEENRPGARVLYEASMTEKEGRVRVKRAISGHLGAGALRYPPSLTSATFAAGAPFSGKAIYSGAGPTRVGRPGKGMWRGSLEVDFPGHAGVRLAGPGFKASIVHARRTEERL